jgi:hypothetical protein
MLPKAVAQRALALCVCGQMINDSQLRTAAAAAMVKGSRPPKHTHSRMQHPLITQQPPVQRYLSLCDVHGWALQGRKRECVCVRVSTITLCAFILGGCKEQVE